MHEMPTICIVHMGFRGFQTFKRASNLVGKLISLRTEIPYDTIHLTLYAKFFPQKFDIYELSTYICT